MIRATVRGIPAILLSASALVSVGLAQNSSKKPIDYVNTLVGTAPLDQQRFVGNAPPPGEPATYGSTTVPSWPATASPNPAADPADAVAVDAALAGYDTLSASQVVRRLESLGPDELRAVFRHEASHRNRRTILNRAQQLLEGAGPDRPTG